ncbi:class I SAM-dependent methyltransferase [Streptomyces sp. NPDC054766]|uniref:class I SAM-dependent methyltransferase n=1 Tax=Streptomyces rhizosphaerihabitans TaxID=1266770 RepID=UPI0021C17125|nr:class I SAM-dependent methyltransferase [Streptomyces rhizosphaerihabitans]MCT9007264.1 class I SAM-dependent methyltransferase [Streptomyces rhizosphaerihabitans]
MTDLTERHVRFGEADMADHLSRLGRAAPDLHACVDPARARAWARRLAQAADLKDDFGEDEDGGRGASYIRAQSRNLTARAQGIQHLLSLVPARADRRPAVVVDVLGGDGLVRRVANARRLTGLSLLTCDASPYMVRAAWAANCPALVQRADRLLMRDGSVDAVLVAYGSHHIAAEDRAELVHEAYRVLRPGGVLLLHDFLVGSPMDTWFRDVVDPYSRTGHAFDHFTREEIRGYLTKAGFESGEVTEMADPYVATAATAREAELELGSYLLDMYGLTGIAREHPSDASRHTVERAKTIFRDERADGSLETFSVAYDASARTWTCTVPRTAVLGIGRKDP